MCRAATRRSSRVSSWTAGERSSTATTWLRVCLRRRTTSSSSTLSPAASAACTTHTSPGSASARRRSRRPRGRSRKRETYNIRRNRNRSSNRGRPINRHRLHSRNRVLKFIMRLITVKMAVMKIPAKSERIECPPYKWLDRVVCSKVVHLYQLSEMRKKMKRQESNTKFLNQIKMILQR